MYNYSKELTAASIIPIILSLLKEKDNYGYALIQDIRELSDGEIQWNQGTLYPVLGKLEKRGYIKSYITEENGRERKYYSLKNNGEKYLDELKYQWLSLNKVLLTMWKPN